MVVVLLVSKKSPYMVAALLASKKGRYGCCPSRIFKTKSLDMVVVLLRFLSNMTHVLLAYSYFIKMHYKTPRITRNDTYTGGKMVSLAKISQND